MLAVIANLSGYAIVFLADNAPREGEGDSMKRLISLSSIVLLLTILLTACGSTTGDTNQPAAGPVKLTYTIWDTNQKSALQQMADAFHKTHPNITVEITVTPWAQYWTKLETAATGGSTSDIFWMNGPNFPKYADNGVIA